MKAIASVLLLFAAIGISTIIDANGNPAQAQARQCWRDAWGVRHCRLVYPRPYHYYGGYGYRRHHGWYGHRYRHHRHRW